MRAARGNAPPVRGGPRARARVGGAGGAGSASGDGTAGQGGRHQGGLARRGALAAVLLCLFAALEAGRVKLGIGGGSAMAAARWHFERGKVMVAGLGSGKAVGELERAWGQPAFATLDATRRAAPLPAGVLGSDHTTSDGSPAPAPRRLLPPPRKQEQTQAQHRQHRQNERERERAPTGPAMNVSPCPAACSGRGTCDELRRKCTCSPPWRGNACDVPMLPACEAPAGVGADDEPINLSLLASMAMWEANESPNDGRVRFLLLQELFGTEDGRVGEPAPGGHHPPLRWLGALPCSCVAQAARLFSRADEPYFLPLPPEIEPHLVRVQGVLCYVDAAGEDTLTVASISRDGSPPLSALRYVPLASWIKGGPTSQPELLPPGALSVEDYAAIASGKWVNRRMSVRVRGGGMDRAGEGDLRDLLARLPAPPSGISERVAAITAVRADLCDGRCGSGGWCARVTDERSDSSGEKPRSTSLGYECRCFSAMLARDGFTEATCVIPESSVARNVVESEIIADREAEGYHPVPDVRSGVDIAVQHAKLLRGAGNFLGPDLWRDLLESRHWHQPPLDACPNNCQGHGYCSYGFCRCPPGRWGLDCGLDGSMLSENHPPEAREGDGGHRLSVYVYEIPPLLRRACYSWSLPERLGERLMRSKYVVADPAKAQAFWVYGCTEENTVLPAMRWVRSEFPHWNAYVDAARAKNSSNAGDVYAPRAPPNHYILTPNEDGWSSIWRSSMHMWFGTDTLPWRAHKIAAAHRLDVESGRLRETEAERWDELHPLSPYRPFGSLQLSGVADHLMPFQPDQTFDPRCVRR